MKIQKGNKHGFTLVELMTVVFIIGILTAVAVPMYSTQTAKTASKEGERALALVISKQEFYRSVRFSYAEDLDLLKVPGLTVTGTTSGTYGDYTITLTPGGDRNSYTLTAEADLRGNGTLDEWSFDSTTDAAPQHTVVGY